MAKLPTRHAFHDTRRSSSEARKAISPMAALAKAGRRTSPGDASRKLEARSEREGWTAKRIGGTAHPNRRHSGRASLPKEPTLASVPPAMGALVAQYPTSQGIVTNFTIPAGVVVQRCKEIVSSRPWPASGTQGPRRSDWAKLELVSAAWAPGATALRGQGAPRVVDDQPDW